METSFYVRIGGESGVRDVVEAFYDEIEERYPALRAMLPEDTRVTRKKLFMYLSGWLGGPQLYIAEYGHPRLRMRHFPFQITTDGASEWLDAMRAAMDTAGVEVQLRDEIMDRLEPLAQHMVNQD